MDPVHLQEENARLHRAVEELTALNDLAHAIALLKEPDEIMHAIVRKATRAVSAAQGTITLVKEDVHDPMHTLIRTHVSMSGGDKHHFTQELLGWMYINKKALIINDPAHDQRFQHLSRQSHFHTMLCVPMMVKSRLIGILTVFDRRDGGTFTEDNARLLGIMAGQSAQIVENARLEEEERQLRKMEHEIMAAATIQSNLLPPRLPSIPGYELFATTTPASSVGGDYYDVVTSTEPQVTFCLGDVSGKGMPAALLMANLQATLRATLATRTGPGETLRQSNQLLYHSTSDDKFATMFLGVLDTQRHELRYANAGHDPAVICSSNGTFRELPGTGLPVGMFEEMNYEESTEPLGTSDVLVVFSDGITEGADPTGEMFGRQRIVDAIAGHCTGSAKAIGQHLLDEVARFTKGTPASDDRTLIVLKRS